MTMASRWKRSILMLFVCLGATSAFAQTQQKTYNGFYDAKKQGYWVLGINGGWAYQSSDVDIDWRGWGLGLTLGKNLYYSPRAPLSLDLRGRLLYTRSYGLDADRDSGIANNDALNGSRSDGLNYLASPGLGYVYDNHKTDIGELALEGVINFENLRRRHRVDLALYGGIGLDWYQTHIDQLGPNGMYDYASIDSKDDLKSLLDKDYETVADGNKESGQIGFMPALGFELGYWFTPRFAFGIGHKATWAKTDILDGKQWTNDNTPTGNNDLYHYTNLSMKWLIEPHRQRLEPPVITIVFPELTPYTSDEPNVTLRATIKNVGSTADVNSRYNGQAFGAYTFSPSGEVFTSNLNLQPGRNEFVINASNPAGSDQETVVIFYREPERPSVRFTNPPNNGYRTQERDFSVRASTTHIYNANQIDYYVNGERISNFKLDGKGDVLVNTRLQEGNNNLRIVAKNKAGQAEDQTTVYYERALEKPFVDITDPYANPYTTDKDNYAIAATVRNVASSNDIELYVNGRQQSSFSYNNERLTANVNLYEGNNVVRVRATNQDGTAEDETTIVYQFIAGGGNNNTNRAPLVDITSTSTPTSTGRSTVVADIQNVDSKNNILFYVNGQRNYDFTFNAPNFRSEVRLQNGNNTVQIRASNNYGQDQDEATITYNTGGGYNPLPTTPPSYQYQPTVNFTRPSNSYGTSNTPSYTVEASTRYVDSKNNIALNINGRRVYDFNFSSSSGRVSANVGLDNGNNDVYIEVVNNYGRANDRTSIRYNAPAPKNPPSVAITKPSSNISTRSSSERVEATIKNVTSKNDIVFAVNGSRSTDFSFASGKLIANVKLSLGNNNVSVRATNSDGSDEASVNIRYEAIVAPPTTPTVPVPPTVKITSISKPVSTPMNPNSTKSTVLAVTQNVASKSDITFIANGRQSTDFTFEPKSGDFKAIIDLQPGRNTVVIRVKNKDGNAEDTQSVDFATTQQQQPPRVNISSPSNGSSSKTAAIILKATITNVTSKSDVKITHNGKSVGTFTFISGLVNAPISLQEGNNDIIVQATNKDGNDEQRVSVKYGAPVVSQPLPMPTQKPSVAITTPLKGGTTTNTAAFTLKASVKNATKSGVSVTLNGSPVGNFTLSSSGALSAGVTLAEGKNVFVVNANNDGGTANATTDINYTKRTSEGGVSPTGTLNKPQVDITSVSKPVSTPMNPNSTKSTVLAKLTGVQNSGQITFTHNGQKITAFEFVPATGDFKSVIDLQKGKNEVKIDVKVGLFKASDTETVNF
jgi:hypothetical protein